MKKLNKILLPLCTATAVAAVCPSLVACGNKTINTGVVDLLSYRPDPSTKLPAQPFNENQATAACFGVKDAVSIVSQDILRYLSWETKYEFMALALALWAEFNVDCANVPNYAVCELSNLSLQYFGTGTTFYARMSGTIALEVNVDVVDEEGQTITPIGTLTIKTKHNLSNVRYQMGYNNVGEWTKDYWIAQLNDEDLSTSDLWSITGSAESVLDYYGPEEDVTQSYTFTYNKDSYDITKLGLITWWSYHLTDCTKG